MLNELATQMDLFFRPAAQQSLAADGAIACFSSNLFSLSLNADRAPQLKASVGLLLPFGNEKRHLHAYAARCSGLLSYCAGHRRHGTCARGHLGRIHRTLM